MSMPVVPQTREDVRALFDISDLLPPSDHKIRRRVTRASGQLTWVKELYESGRYIFVPFDRLKEKMTRADATHLDNLNAITERFLRDHVLIDTLALISKRETLYSVWTDSGKERFDEGVHSLRKTIKKVKESRDLGPDTCRVFTIYANEALSHS